MARQKLVKGRTGLILDHVFFGNLGLRLELKEDGSAPTMWTDGKSLGYNPEFVNSLSMKEIQGVLVHEILHCALLHHTRRSGRDPAIWNMACDYAVNLLVIDAGMVLPQGGLIDARYRDLTAEKIYDMLMQENGPSVQSQKGQGGDPGGAGEIRDAVSGDGDSPADGADLKQIEGDWKVAVAQAANQAAAAGRLPGGIKRMVEIVTDPALDWRVVLRRFVDTNAYNDYAWFPPHRRYLNRGMVLPSVRSEELGLVHIAVDTSGSIDMDRLNQFAAEISDIAIKFRATIKVIYADYRVFPEATQEFLPDELLELEPKGGGGTDFRPVFNYLNEENEFPTVFIYFTDGECDSFPDFDPGYPVLWAVYGRSAKEFSPPFGEVVLL